ncbi:hypothetical protein FN846DRAFT_914474 [Sphaerosporella brunnea]|uniref:DUF4219 domain-containing protein n=1 Tax=Sphaerosporella brunnea TaxID=1250544 RepID=A0A5J5ECW3_9PEZI|nr:hypothetical protein FN846DRAFT_914474 [Sphaerosporella brunnea]
MSTSTTGTTITKLNEHNYRAWVLATQDVLKQLSLWPIINGIERVPVQEISSKYERYELQQDQYDEKQTNACCTICFAFERSIRQRYLALKYDDPRVHWETIQSDFENVIQRDGQNEQQKLATCKLEDFPSVTEWIAAPDHIINDLAICGIELEQGGTEPADDLGAGEGGIDSAGVAAETEEGAKGWQRVFLEEVA